MRLKTPSRIDRIQWLQRMGIKGEPPASLLKQMADMEVKLLAAAMPQGIYRVVPVDGLTLEGIAIKRHLRGCNEAAIMGVTLGSMVDNLIRISQIRDMAEAVILDCAASVLVEQIADDLEAIIGTEQKKHMTGRYSPGYGDYPIKMQTEIMWLMDSHRKIGLTVNENFMMTPQKSITAIIGLSEQPVEGYLATCSECVLREKCELRKEGKTCAGLQE